MRIIDQIHERSAFTPTEREIAAYLEEHSKESVNISLDELSKKIFVSKSTIIRFCKKLGFKGHKELCVQLAKELNTYLLDDRRINSSFPFEVTDDRKNIADKVYALSYGALVQTYQDLDLEQVYRVARAIYLKNGVCIYSFGESNAIAKCFADNLQDLGMRVHLCAMMGESAMQASTQLLDSAALFITYRAKDPIEVQTAKILSARKIPVYLVNGPFKGAVTAYAQEAIEASPVELDPKCINISSRNSIALILDIIYAYIYSFDMEKNEKMIQDRYRLIKSMSEGNHS